MGLLKFYIERLIVTKQSRFSYRIFHLYAAPRAERDLPALPNTLRQGFPQSTEASKVWACGRGPRAWGRLFKTQRGVFSSWLETTTSGFGALGASAEDPGGPGPHAATSI